MTDYDFSIWLDINGDSHSLTVTAPVSDYEYNVLVQCSEDEGAVEDYDDLADLRAKVLEAALKELELDDVDPDEISYTVYVPQEIAEETGNIEWDNYCDSSLRPKISSRSKTRNRFSFHLFRSIRAS